ncbi:hypothetical protein GDO78_008232 [Eleutherodactylus coqui]|uniref:Uncharacterized protein n=1 Tax=Eleutherodactylus coqui TaxID=57060 RepID=A0A8J6FDZ2_ELECQ|nr:hypothetical protein GDO78_008232 [Eleutherodactylus coqui]
MKIHDGIHHICSSKTLHIRLPIAPRDQTGHLSPFCDSVSVTMYSGPERRQDKDSHKEEFNKFIAKQTIFFPLKP